MDLPVTALTGHAVVVGLGRVGRLVVDGLQAAKVPFLVIEERHDRVAELRARGIEVLSGNAAHPAVVAAANLAAARWLFVAVPDAFDGGQIVEQARAINPALDIVARASSDAEVEHLTRHGAGKAIMGEREIARRMLEEVPAEAGPAAA
jgi:CPA2 family monovalent cation:H+ antiporter-2